MTYKPFIREVVSAGNSSTTPLLTGATFTGTGELSDLPQVGVMVKSDVNTTMFFDFSNDGTNWDSTFPVQGFECAANISEFHTAVKLGRYFRLRLVNNGADQTFLRLKTYFGADFIPSAAPLNQSLARDQDAIVVRNTIPQDEIVQGLRTGALPFNKFSHSRALTASAGEETIWPDPTNNFIPMVTASTFTITYNNATDGLGTTGALSLLIQYIDVDGLARDANHVLGNTGSDVTSFTGLGINRVAVSSSGLAQFNTNAIVISETTGATIQAYVPALGSVTQQAVYFNDANSVGVGKFVWINANKLSGGGSPRIQVKAYVFNRSIQTRFEIFRALIDTSSDSFIVISEPVGFRLSPADVLYWTADTDTNNAVVNIRFSVISYKIS